LNWQHFQVAILQDELEAKDLELRRRKEMLSQKEYTAERALEEAEEARNDLNTALDPQQVEVES
jgi:pre-mRNA-splicing regulator WTAP